MRNQIWYMVLILGLVGGAGGLALSAVKEKTSPVIEKRNLEQKIKPSLEQFFGPLGVDNDYIADRLQLDLGQDSRGRKLRLTVFRGKQGGELIAVALQTKQGGYGGDIQVLTTLDLKNEKILGVKTIDQKETKGLGARVADDREPFIQQFAGMSYAKGVALQANGGKVDAISGATISSMAYAGAVNKAVKLLDERRSEIIQ